MLTVNFNPFPVIETERLVLRRTLQSDVAEIFFLRSDPRVMQYIKKTPCQNLEEAAAFIRERLDATIDNNEGVQWAMTVKGDNRLIGSIGIWRLMKEHYRGEIGYSMHPDYWGKGYMQEAVMAAIAYGFNTLGLHSLEAQTDVENRASQQLLERCGFMKEGHRREDYLYEGVFYDTACYGLVRPR